MKITKTELKEMIRESIKEVKSKKLQEQKSRKKAWVIMVDNYGEISLVKSWEEDFSDYEIMNISFDSVKDIGIFQQSNVHFFNSSANARKITKLLNKSAEDGEKFKTLEVEMISGWQIKK